MYLSRLFAFINFALLVTLSVVVVLEAVQQDPQAVDPVARFLNPRAVISADPANRAVNVPRFPMPLRERTLQRYCRDHFHQSVNIDSMNFNSCLSREELCAAPTTTSGHWIY